ncbi:MAG: heavy metal translocating P-type ATPase [Eubacteriales bacterium]|nr:heavy metal translocating P-type ATPase [Eubacteriales bacterium]
MKKDKFSVTGMTCAACQANVTKAVSRLEGVQKADVSLLANQMTVEYDENLVDAAAIAAAVVDVGYGAALLGAKTDGERAGGFRSEWQARRARAEEEAKALRRRLYTSLALLAPLMYLAMGHMMHLPLPGIFTGEENTLIAAFTQFLLTIPVLFVNRKFFIVGFRALIKRSPNMDSLVAVGSAASLIYGVFALYRMMYGLSHGDPELVSHYSHQLYFESAAMILSLVTVGKTLEARSKAKTTDALDRLVDLAPKTASVLRDGVETILPTEELAVGDIIIIRPGESIPADGEILDGTGYINQSAITGESVPVEKGPGDTVICATINKNGSFRFRASKVGDDTTLAQIIRLVDEAGSEKAPIARLADRVSGVFVPIVIAIALVTAIVWLLVGKDFEFALSCAISVLVISCPCALGLATPVAIMVGTGRAAESGILIKSAESLENLHLIDTVVLDKTGTITEGHPSVTDVIVLDNTLGESEFLTLAASAEAGSEHPLAEAVVEYAKGKGLTLPEAQDFEAVSGRGVKAAVTGKTVLAGNAAFLAENGISADLRDRTEGLAAAGKTPLLFAVDGKPVGIIAVADTIRESSRHAIERFREMGIEVIMLTGDNRVTAESIRSELGIVEAVAEVLPAEKEAHIRALQARGKRVAMIGDGINDAPALMRADIGIAIGAGTDVAIESADVVLMRDSLMDAVTAVELSRAVIRNIRMNLFWALFYNILGIPVAAGVLYPLFQLRLNPMIGSAAMSMSSVCVVTNALRLRFFRPSSSTEAAGENENMEGSAAEAAAPIPAETENTISDSAEPFEKKGLDNTMEKTMKIEGMMCGHCQMHVKKALEGVAGVVSADVDWEKGTAIVTMDADVTDEALTAAVTDAGYTVL